jgi:glutathione S-transferase
MEMSVRTVAEGYLLLSLIWYDRWVLNYKKLPYRTVWVEYPDIKPLSLEIGASPTSYDPDGTPFYTLPAIHDPNTGKSISDSFDIAQYLDATYPERPVLPSGTEGLQNAFVYAIEPVYKVCWHDRCRNHHLTLEQTIFALAAPAIAKSLNQASQEYWRRTREARVGRSLEDFCPVGVEREKAFKGLQRDLSRITGNTQKNRNGGLFIMGNQISFGDFVIASVLMWAKIMLSTEEYNKIMSFNDGRWKMFMQSLEEYAAVDGGEVYSPRGQAKI